MRWLGNAARSSLDQATQLRLQRLPVEPQPVALFAPVGHEAFDERPETFGVVADAQVAELVDDDVAERGGGAEPRLSSSSLRSSHSPCLRRNATICAGCVPSG